MGDAHTNGDASNAPQENGHDPNISVDSSISVGGAEVEGTIFASDEDMVFEDCQFGVLLWTYAKSLTNLCGFNSSENTSAHSGTTYSAFDKVRKQLAEVAQAHERFSTAVLDSLVEECSVRLKELDTRRKQVLSDGNIEMKGLKEQLNNMEKSKSAYFKASRNRAQAENAYDSAGAEDEPDQEKLAKLDSKKSQTTAAASEKEDDYRKALDAYNEKLDSTYRNQMSQILNRCELLDRGRIDLMHEWLQHYAASWNNTCLSDVQRSSYEMFGVLETLSREFDTNLFIRHNRPYRDGPTMQLFVPYELHDQGREKEVWAVGIIEGWYGEIMDYRKGRKPTARQRSPSKINHGHEDTLLKFHEICIRTKLELAHEQAYLRNITISDLYAKAISARVAEEEWSLFIRNALVVTPSASGSRRNDGGGQGRPRTKTEEKLGGLLKSASQNMKGFADKTGNAMKSGFGKVKMKLKR